MSDEDYVMIAQVNDSDSDFEATPLNQASIINLGLNDLCFDLEPWNGEIVTVTGVEMGMIKFKGFIYFLGVQIKVYVAEIITSIIVSCTTALHSGFTWTMRPKNYSSV
jgi:hypothetical protein